MWNKCFFIIFILVLVIANIGVGCSSSSNGGSEEVQYTLNVELKSLGDGTGGEVLLPGGDKYEKDSIVEITPEANEGWTFYAWQGEHGEEVSFDEDKWKIVMDGDKSIQAVFVEVEFDEVYRVDFAEANELEGVNVEIYLDEGYQYRLEGITTDNNGKFELELWSDDYYFKANYSGYEEYEGSFTVAEQAKSITVTMVEKTIRMINELEELEMIGESEDYPADGYYELANNINANLTTESSYNEGKGWEPITNFSGVFDGAGYEISNLYISRPEEEEIGLFAILDGEVSNLDITDLDIEGKKYVGGLAGRSGGEIKNVFINGTIKGEASIGGISGENSNLIADSAVDAELTGEGEIGISRILGGLAGGNIGVIKNSSADIEIVNYGRGDYENAVGGLVGINNNDGEIREAFVNGKITSQNTQDVGGLAGINAGEIRKSYSKSNINGSDSCQVLGGLVGNNFGKVIDSYASGDVAGNNYVGGLAGINQDSGYENIILNSYAVGLVAVHDSTGVDGGLLAENFTDDEKVQNSYWDIEASGKSYSGGGTGKTTADMKQETTFTEWDFNSIWTIDEGNDYPRLQWE